MIKNLFYSVYSLCKKFLHSLYKLKLWLIHQRLKSMTKKIIEDDDICLEDDYEEREVSKKSIYVKEEVLSGSYKSEKVIIPWQWETVPNPNTIIVNFPFVISKDHIESFWLPLKPESEKYMGKVGGLGRSIILKLGNDVPGLTEICIQRYRMTLSKGSCFKWESIINDIDDCLLELFPAYAKDHDSQKLKNNHTNS